MTESLPRDFLERVQRQQAAQAAQQARRTEEGAGESAALKAAHEHRARVISVAAELGPLAAAKIEPQRKLLITVDPPPPSRITRFFKGPSQTVKVEAEKLGWVVAQRLGSAPYEEPAARNASGGGGGVPPVAEVMLSTDGTLFSYTSHPRLDPNLMEAHRDKLTVLRTPEDSLRNVSSPWLTHDDVLNGLVDLAVRNNLT